MSFLDDHFHGLVDAALDLHRVVPGGHELGALAEDRLCEHGGSRGAVAGHVAGLRGNFAHQQGTHVLELVLETPISLATVTPSLVTVGAPKLLSMTTLRPRGPRVTFDRVSERVHAVEDQVASDFLVNDFLWQAIFLYSPRSAFDDAEDVVFAQNQSFFAVKLDLGTRVLAEQDAVARLDVERADPCRPPAPLRVADSENFAFDRLLFGAVRDDDPALGLLFFFDARLTITRSCSGRILVAM